MGTPDLPCMQCWGIQHHAGNCNTLLRKEMDNPTTKKEQSVVDHPSHYNVGKIEVIDAIEEWGLNFNLGNSVKYIARCNYKGNKLQDLEKAAWYLLREISKLKEVK